MGEADDGAHDGALPADAATTGPEVPMNSQSHQSLQMVQTKQDREKRITDPFYETQNLPAYGQPRVRIAGVSPGKPLKKMSLSQLKNRKLNKFQGHAYGLRSQSPGRSPGKPAPATGSDSGPAEDQIDIEDQQNRGPHHTVSQSGLLPSHEGGMPPVAEGQPFFSTR